MTCSVYIFGYSDLKHGHVVKIGIARDVFARLNTVQTHNHNTVIPHFHFDLPSRRDAFNIEQRFHTRFADQRIRGEWFALDDNEALYFLTMQVVRFLSTRFFGEELRRQRCDTGLIKAFTILDAENPGNISQWESDWNQIESETL